MQSVRIFPIPRRIFFRELNQGIPETSRSQQSLLARFCPGNPQGMSRRRTARFQNDLHAVFAAKRARRICVGITRQNLAQRRNIRLPSLPPISEGMKNDRSGAQDLLHALAILARDTHDHIHQFPCAKRLAHHRTHAEVFGFFFSVFYGDGFGQRHNTILSHSARVRFCGDRCVPRFRDRASIFLWLVIPVPTVIVQLPHPERSDGSLFSLGRQACVLHSPPNLVCPH
jgi:hypothetical protein